MRLKKKHLPIWRKVLFVVFIFSVMPLAYLPPELPVVVVVVMVIAGFIYIVFFTLSLVWPQSKAIFFELANVF